MFADDNYGNVMQVLDPEMADRSSGAGIYYHADCMSLVDICLLIKADDGQTRDTQGTGNGSTSSTLSRVRSVLTDRGC